MPVKGSGALATETASFIFMKIKLLLEEYETYRVWRKKYPVASSEHRRYLICMLERELKIMRWQRDKYNQGEEYFV